MKIALICDSLLLDRSLEMYLKEYLTSYKLCDFVVATQPVESQKPVFLIGDFEGANLKIPFTRELLLQELDTFYQSLKGGRLSDDMAQEMRDIKAINATSASFIGSKIESPNIQNTLEIPLISQDSALNAKLEDILRRYAKEIETAILEHLSYKNA
ncbi:hypothetical protein [Helicobacter sp.]|uniref:hypothetical protein n=1 Tax=Helicobacter sp. TaxID=218 RepID=UPI0025C3F702|nr:hypothetical protein [Helicobacter sp.]MCI5632201.1 hypothetical protein [Helicobacter sp.]